MTLVAVKLTDAEWRLKCEELAKAELRRKAKRGQLAEEDEEWKSRKKDLNGQIDILSNLCEKLALEVSNKEALAEAQSELPIASEEQPEEREAGADG